MKIAVFGAGAIGGYLAVKLHQAGADVSVIARGPHLAAMRERGLTLKSDGETVTVRLPCTDRAEDAGAQDYVIVTLKANGLMPAAPEIAKLMGPQTALVTGINGVPYWYFYGQDGPWRDRKIQSVDPGGRLWDLLPPRQVIGCIVYPAAEVTEPGVVEHTYGNRFTLGEPDGSKSPRVEVLSQMLVKAGLKAPVRTNIRDEIWVKLWGNLAFNPLSALTSSTLDRLAFRPELRAVARCMMEEAQVVGEALGAKFAVSIDKRMDGAGEIGAHKTSMLQDLERGRPMEIDALLGAVVELAELTGKRMPLCKTMLALVRERARQAGCYPD
ncbi:MAG TPA: 2-dehydropantoate 2-reductase [Rhizomicrobium sp.]|jgi:2-dehydropantoate 2-reductase|nr:2-dehydropantoate 2-reductase [Rhizomicrobium sp.]